MIYGNKPDYFIEYIKQNYNSIQAHESYDEFESRNLEKSSNMIFEFNSIGNH